ncbi:hypothetical protein [Actinomycetospora lemnae]|uniref:Uncharacterized protein n=1 Tax=Actinomycetospora lemnae TaxID=3019891 RepID=A0ABT5STP9_9PSEU|nr:hypothetical protein [Actinomycetospora sp. DW7H6]MDD7966144.1 hypothetical protein [Actinomycetospora sp. DW7H6]
MPAVATHHEHHHQRADQHEETDQERLDRHSGERQADDEDRERNRVQGQMLALHGVPFL